MSAPGESSGDEMPGRIAAAVRVIALVGDLDFETSPKLREQLNALIADGVTVIVLDCADLEYIDSAGLGILVSALKQTANRAGALALARPSEPIRQILKVTGLFALFAVYGTVDEACAALSQAASNEQR